MYNWDVKIPGQRKKNYYCKEHKFSLILFIEATNTTPPLVTLPPSSVDHGQHAGHRPELYASLFYYFTARYFTHDQCGEWKYSNFRGEISYFTHELYAQNCIKAFMYLQSSTTISPFNVSTNHRVSLALHLSTPSTHSFFIPLRASTQFQMCSKFSSTPHNSHSWFSNPFLLALPKFPHRNLATVFLTLQPPFLRPNTFLFRTLLLFLYISNKTSICRP